MTSSSVEERRAETNKERQHISFKVVQGEKGPQAEKVQSPGQECHCISAVCDTRDTRRAVAWNSRTHRQARDILGNPVLTVYDNPHSLLMCVYNRDRALCHRLDVTDAPSLDRCQPSCANNARTDRHADELLQRAKTLEKQAASEAVPGPLADRLTQRADHLRSLADRHNHDRIRAAMDRILRSTPELSNGALTIVALAVEAGVPRNALTQRHTDLKNEFYDKVRARGGTPDSEQRLRKQIRRLKQLRAADAEKIAQLKADVEALIGALHQATVENRLLREQIAEQHPVVRALPYQLPPGPPPVRPPQRPVVHYLSAGQPSTLTSQNWRAGSSAGRQDQQAPCGTQARRQHSANPGVW